MARWWSCRPSVEARDGRALADEEDAMGGDDMGAAVGMSQLLDSAIAFWMSFAAVEDMPEVSDSEGDSFGEGGGCLELLEEE